MSASATSYMVYVECNLLYRFIWNSHYYDRFWCTPTYESRKSQHTTHIVPVQSTHLWLKCLLLNSTKMYLLNIKNDHQTNKRVMVYWVQKSHLSYFGCKRCVVYDVHWIGNCTILDASFVPNSIQSIPGRCAHEAGRLIYLRALHLSFSSTKFCYSESSFDEEKNRSLQ